MNRIAHRRLDALERRSEPGGWEKVHQITIDKGEDADTLIAALCASGEAKESDLFIVRVFVSPPS